MTRIRDAAFEQGKWRGPAITLPVLSVLVGLSWAVLLTLVLSGKLKAIAGFTDLYTYAGGNGVQARRPNLLMVVTDDQRFDTMDYMPQTRTRIFDEGISFSNAYAPIPLCGPSRVSILTGMFARSTGAFNNYHPISAPTIFDELHNVGYRTGYFGKYVNSWNSTPRPEYDQWVEYVGGGQLLPRYNVDGHIVTFDRHDTVVTRDFVLGFLDQADTEDTPFALMWAPIAPHSPYDPIPEYRGLYDDIDLGHPPNYNETDYSDKPRFRPLLPSDLLTEMDNARIRQLEMLHGVDVSMGMILDKLEETGALSNTIVVFLSDNGIQLGEHRGYYEKGTIYEEVSHIPLAIRYSAQIHSSSKSDAVVSTADIAPTIYHLMGISPSAQLDGRSLVSEMNSAGTVQYSVFLPGAYKGAPLAGEYTLVGPQTILAHRLKDRSHIPMDVAYVLNGYLGIHTGRYVYFENYPFGLEFYDLAIDPFQLYNRIEDPAYKLVIDDLHILLDRERNASSPSVKIFSNVVIQRNSIIILEAATRGVPDSQALTYTWNSRGFMPTIHLSGITDTMSYRIESSGTTTVSVSVETPVGVVEYMQTLFVQDPVTR